MKQSAKPINLKKIKTLRALSWILYITWIFLNLDQTLWKTPWLNFLSIILIILPLYWVPIQYRKPNFKESNTLPLWFKSKKADTIFSILMYLIPLILLAIFILYQRFLKS